MAEWWTYSLTDFLLFSADTYYRLFERYNRAAWPFQLLPLVGGMGSYAAMRFRADRWGRGIATLLAAAWLWVAWGYHLQRYATINWAAPAFAALFAIEAALLIWTGAVRSRLVFSAEASTINRVGRGIFCFGLLGQPLVTPLLGRPWDQAELFGMAPDPTAIATLGMLLLVPNRIHWGLVAIPLLWCAVSGATLYGLSSPNAVVLLIAGSLAGGCACAKSWSKRSASVSNSAKF